VGLWQLPVLTVKRRTLASVKLVSDVLWKKYKVENIETKVKDSLSCAWTMDMKTLKVSSEVWGESENYCVYDISS
jgi:hypothetical protein